MKKKILWLTAAGAALMIAAISIVKGRAYASSPIHSVGTLKMMKDGDLKICLYTEDIQYLKGEIDRLFSELEDNAEGSCLSHT